VIELVRALAVLAEPPGPEQRRLAEVLGLDGAVDDAAYTEVFTLQLYPYAAVYAGAEGMLGGEAADRLAGFWTALQRTPPAEPDHLAALLGLYASLAEREGGEADPARRLMWRVGRKALLWEHLACWLFPYLDKLREIAPPCYRSWAALLGETLAAEIGTVGPPDMLPLHLRLAPPLPDPRRDGASAFVRGLLAPVRSGVVLTKADLARAAHDLGLGLRMGERRFILETLLAQDAAALLTWLAAEARDAAARHRRHAHVTGPVAQFWTRRAGEAAALLGELAPAACVR
jgi:Nitrate reductase delta subunit